MILVRVMFVAFNQELTYSINNEEYRSDNADQPRM